MRHGLFAVAVLLAISTAGLLGMLATADQPTSPAPERVTALLVPPRMARATPQRVRRRHVTRVRRTGVDAPAVAPIDETESEWMRGHEEPDAHATVEAPDPAPTGQLDFPDLYFDLHVEIDGERKYTRRHDVAPGTHSVILFLGEWEIGRASVHVLLGGVTQVTIDDFRVDTVCMARLENETLRPERPVRRCCSNCRNLAMDWLSRHQSADGSWSASRFQEACRGKVCEGTSDDVGAAESTALALLTYLGSGETHNLGAYKHAVASGLKWLRDGQDDDGWLVGPDDRRANAIAALAMVEAYGLTGSRLFGPSATAALNAIMEAPLSSDAETAALEACVLVSADRAKMLAEERGEPLAATLRHLESFGLPGSSRPRENALLLGSRALLIEKPSEDRTLTAAVGTWTRVLATRIDEGRADTIDPLTTYFTTVAAFQVGGSPWKAWNAKVEQTVIDTQDTLCHRGSWAPASAATGAARSRLTTSVFNMLTLEIYYRYGRVFGGSSR